MIDLKGSFKMSTFRPIIALSMIMLLSLLCATLQAHAQFNAMGPPSSWSWSFGESPGDGSYNYDETSLYNPTNIIGLPNPAAVYCEENGGTIQIRDTAEGQTGYCIFPDGSSCGAWDFYNGLCGPQSSETKKSKQFIISVLDRNSMNLQGAEVFIDGVLVGKTDNNGKVIATVTFDAHVAGAKAYCGEFNKIYYFSDNIDGITLYIDTCPGQSGPIDGVEDYIYSIIQGEIVRILEYDGHRYVFEVRVDKVISNPGNFITQGQYLTIIVPEGGYKLFNQLQVGTCVEARGKPDTELYCEDGDVSEISCASITPTDNIDKEYTVKIVPEDTYLAGRNALGEEAKWRYKVTSYPSKGPALYSTPTPSINADVFYKHNLDFGGLQKLTRLRAVLKVWHEDYESEPKTANYPEPPLSYLSHSDCQFEENGYCYACFGGCTAYGNKWVLHLELPENTPKGWYDAQIELYYTTNAGDSWNLGDSWFIPRAFEIREYDEPDDIEPSSSEIWFKGTAVERHEGTSAGEASYWTVTVDEKIRGPDPLFSPLKVITYQAISPTVWGETDSTIKEGDKVVVYGKYDEHKSFYGNCYVTLHGSEDYYIKKDRTPPDHDDSNSEVNDHEVLFPDFSEIIWSEKPIDDYGAGPVTSYARVTIRLSSLSGYSAIVDDVRSYNDYSDGSLDGVVSFTVTGERYHGITITSPGYDPFYIQVVRHFSNGYDYTLTV